MSSADVVSSSLEGAVLAVELNRPQTKKALNEEVFEQLFQTLRDAETNSDIRVVVLTGRNDVFCSGADISALDEFRAMALIKDRHKACGELWSYLETFPKPTIAAIEVLALGGGLELALACDIIIVGKKARLGLPEVALGVIPGGGGTQRIMQVLGKTQAMWLLLSGDMVTGEAAEKMGLAAKAVDDGTVLTEAHVPGRKDEPKLANSYGVGKKRCPRIPGDAAFGRNVCRAAQLPRSAPLTRQHRRPTGILG